MFTEQVSEKTEESGKGGLVESSWTRLLMVNWSSIRIFHAAEIFHQQLNDETEYGQLIGIWRKDEPETSDLLLPPHSLLLLALRHPPKPTAFLRAQVKHTTSNCKFWNCQDEFP